MRGQHWAVPCTGRWDRRPQDSRSRKGNRKKQRRRRRRTGKRSTQTPCGRGVCSRRLRFFLSVRWLAAEETRAEKKLHKAESSERGHPRVLSRHAGQRRGHGPPQRGVRGGRAVGGLPPLRRRTLDLRGTRAAAQGRDGRHIRQRLLRLRAASSVREGRPCVAGVHSSLRVHVLRAWSVPCGGWCRCWCER